MKEEEDSQRILYKEYFPLNEEIEERINYVTIDEILDKIGYTRYHLMMIIIVGLSLASDGVELYLIYLITPVLKKVYSLSESQVNIVISSLFFGIGIGAISSGIFFMQHGRRNVMLLFLTLITFFGTTCVLIDNIYWFLFCRLIIGVSIGVLFNLTNALCEILPKKYRDFLMGSIYFYVKLGIVYFVFIFMIFTNTTDPVYNYKYIIIVSSIPMYICLFLAFLFYDESPRILLMTHRKYEEAFVIINKIAEGSQYVLTERDKEGLVNQVMKYKCRQDDSPVKILKSLFKKRYAQIFIMVTLLWVINLLILFTNIYSLPIMLNNNSKRIFEKSEEENSSEMNINISMNRSQVTNNLLKNNNNSSNSLELTNISNSTNNSIQDNNKSNFLLNSNSFTNNNTEDKERAERHENIKKILIANIIPLPAEFLAGYLTSLPSLGRKNTMSLGLIFEMFFAMMIIINPESLHIYSSMIIFFNVLSFNICKLYTAEVFHTDVRDTAYGFSNFCSRIASVFIPYIASFTFHYSNYGPCYFIAMISFSGFVICLMLPFDTFNRPLDSSEDLTELNEKKNESKVNRFN